MPLPVNRLVITALWELLRYDMIDLMFGFPGILHTVRGVRPRALAPRAVPEVCDAVETACCLYFRKVLCLQRAAVTTRLLRKRGQAAELVVGYQPVPFLGHSWVELGGKILNDSQSYRQRLHVLMRA
jgi:hypothetical protein